MRRDTEITASSVGKQAVSCEGPVCSAWMSPLSTAERLRGLHVNAVLLINIFSCLKKKNQQQQPTHSYSHQLWHKICADINILQIFTLNKNKNKRNTSRLWTTTHSPLQVGWLYMPFHTPGRLFSFSRPTLPQPFLVITALISTRLSAWPGSHSCHSLQAVTKMFCMLC